MKRIAILVLTAATAIACAGETVDVRSDDTEQTDETEPRENTPGKDGLELGEISATAEVNGVALVARTEKTALQSMLNKPAVEFWPAIESGCECGLATTGVSADSDGVSLRLVALKMDGATKNLVLTTEQNEKAVLSMVSGAGSMTGSYVKNSLRSTSMQPARATTSSNGAVVTLGNRVLTFNRASDGGYQIAREDALTSTDANAGSCSINFAADAITVTGSNGSALLKFEKDGSGNLTRMVSGTHATEFRRGTDGRLGSVTTKKGDKTLDVQALTWSTGGQLMTHTVDSVDPALCAADGSTSDTETALTRVQERSFSYDSGNNVIGIADAKNPDMNRAFSKVATPDGAIKVVESVGSEQMVTYFSNSDSNYFKQGALLGNGQMGRPMSITNQTSMNATSMVYKDDVGNTSMMTFTNSTGVLNSMVCTDAVTGMQTTTTYDQFGNVTKETDGSNTMNYAYDQGGRLLSTTSASFTQNNSYDSSGRLISQNTSSSDGSTQTFTNDGTTKITTVLSAQGWSSTSETTNIDGSTSITTSNPTQISKETFDASGNFLSREVWDTKATRADNRGTQAANALSYKKFGRPSDSSSSSGDWCPELTTAQYTEDTSLVMPQIVVK